jgi:hypothetical protein
MFFMMMDILNVKKGKLKVKVAGLYTACSRMLSLSAIFQIKNQFFLAKTYILLYHLISV